MRLIEVDALERVLSEQITDDRGGNLTVEDIANNEAIVDTMRIIHEQPTVDAIPVEWIKEYIELQESYDTEIGDIFGVGVREMLRYCAQRKEFAIDDSPTVDAVPVIRCKDCVKYKIFNDSYCPWIEQEVEEDFFCADGKRKEE